VDAGLLTGVPHGEVTKGGDSNNGDLGAPQAIMRGAKGDQPMGLGLGGRRRSMSSKRVRTTWSSSGWVRM